MHYRVKKWVIFNKVQFTHICQLNVSYVQDSVSGIVHKLNETRNKVHLMKNNENKCIEECIMCKIVKNVCVLKKKLRNINKALSDGKENKSEQAL
jgi:phage-related protein